MDRQAGTPADGQTRNWFRGLVEGHGFEVRYDAVGNQFALLELVPGAPYIAVGSHLDSQPFGGRFDGAYGVLAGAHAAIRLKERMASEADTGAESFGAVDAAPLFNIAVINWFNEEGCRFKPSMMGSSVFTGKLPAEKVLATTDPSRHYSARSAGSDRHRRATFPWTSLPTWRSILSRVGRWRTTG